MDFSSYEASRLVLVGGHPALDLVNTVDWRLSPTRRQDWLTTYSEFVAWGLHAGLLRPNEAEALVRRGEESPDEARAAVQTVRAFREALYQLLSDALRGRRPEAEELAVFNAVLARALAACRVVPGKDGFAWEFERTAAPLEYPLYPVVKAAAELLVSPQLPRVKQCADEACGWLFLDTSKNRSRRWCTMQSCGNRAKARRYYRRRRGSQASGAAGSID